VVEGFKALIEGSDRIFICYTGMETDLIFNRGIDLPGFASYPLLESAEKRDILRGYYGALIDLARQQGAGAILESVTWVANSARGAALGYSPETLASRNKAAIALIEQVRDECGYEPVVLSANIGPRDDAYAPSGRMSVDEARVFHSEQIGPLAETHADVISGYTVCSPEEAIGMALSAREFDMPIVISFTVETDGRLPTGTTLGEAIHQVDEATSECVSYYMVNCAHPDHFSGILGSDAWMQRLRGLVVNASRCSHAELDEAVELDDGDPAELGELIGEIHHAHPQIAVLGGCCGTDMRHLRSILARVPNSRP
jgi:homocysteine S-methyltransferase